MLITSYFPFDLTQENINFGTRMESDTFKSALVIITKFGTIDLRMTCEQLDSLRNYLNDRFEDKQNV